MILDAVGTRMQSAYLLSAVALGIAWAFTAVLARRSASVRHHIWAVALTVSIAAPVAREIVPRLDLPLLRPDAAVSALPSTRVTIVDRARPETVGNEHTLPAAWSIAAIEAIVWLAGAVPLLCVRTLRRARLSRLAAEASDVDGQVDVRSHHGVRVPMLAGLRPPVVLLPTFVADWPIELREAVLAHERAHVQRRDDVVALVCDVATILYWLNPLTWLAAAALERERETACDEEVLRTGIKPSAYAAALLKVGETLPARRIAASAPSIGGGRLDARIRAVLHHAPHSGRVPLSWPATIALISLCAVSVASVRLVARTPHQTMVAARPMPARDLSSSRAAESPGASQSVQRSSTSAGPTRARSISPLNAAELGSALDARDFCCPDYLVAMVARIHENWAQYEETPGTPCVPSADTCLSVVRFTIDRNGTISRVLVEEPSGYRTLDRLALAAVRGLRKLPPLPAAFPKRTLTVHLKFAASSKPARAQELETPSKPVAFSAFMQDAEAGQVEEVAITGQRVSGVYRADRETFHTYAPAQYEGLADTLSALGILVRRDDRQQ